jgi:hypothetical protein
MSLINRWRTFRSAKAAAANPLPGISLSVEKRTLFGSTSDPRVSVEELEIGAIGPSELQFVLISSHRRATVKLSAEQARWLAGALVHWADDSEAIPLQ